MRAFNLFCVMHNLHYPASAGIRPSEDVLSYFVCHCHLNLKLTYATTKSYLAGIRNHFIESGLGNPMCDNFGQPLWSLKSILKGLRKENGKPKLQRLPITADILKRIFIVLGNSLFHEIDTALMKAVCSMAWFGFLRCSEFTTLNNSFDPGCNVTNADVHLTSSAVRFTLKASKTDPFRQGRIIHFFSVNNSICPVHAISSYMGMKRSRFTCYDNAPFFVRADGNHLTRNTFVKMLQITLRTAGINPDGYYSHSFRIGACTSAANNGVNDHVIKELGRWSSNCYQLYAKESMEKLRQAHLQMCR